MKQYLAHLGERLRSSFWSLPLLMILLAVALARLMGWLDSWVDPASHSGLQWLRLRDPDSARALLSAIAGSTITVAGTVFSITVVALTLASNQFGPRLVRNFIRDRGIQASLGIFLATFVYALLTMRGIGTLGEGAGNYDLAVQAAVLLALFSIGFLIFFIHNVAQAIQVDNVTHNINRELHQAIEREYPRQREDRTGERIDSSHLQSSDDWLRIPTRLGGYVQRVDKQKLVALAQTHNCRIRMSCHAGTFLNHWGSIGHIYPSLRDADAAIGEIQAALHIGPQPTAEQDIVFSVHQLSQIAVRALSPGINDPYSAYACIDRLIEGLGTILQRPQPPNCFRDDEGHLRLITCELEFHQLLDAALDEICEYSRGNGVVMRQLLDALSQLADICTRAGDKTALKNYLDLLQEDCRTFIESRADLSIIEEKVSAIHQKLTSR